MKPSVSLFEMLHPGIEFVQKLISKEFIIQDIPLPSRVMIGTVISGSRKVKPFLRLVFTMTGSHRVPYTLVMENLERTKFVPFKAQPTFSSKSMCDQSNHFVELGSDSG